MNKLIIGSNQQPLLQSLPERFLIIDDGPIIDQLGLPERSHVTVFDVLKDSFNPLKDMNYLKAREFVNVLDARFPEGANTLTKRASNFLILNALLDKPRDLEHLIKDGKDPYQKDAYQKIQTLLLSPVLKNVLNNPTTMSFKGSIIARLDRAELGDFDCFVLANLLISQYDGPVVIPDFGFYACPSHVKLIRQNRLIAGIGSLNELPWMRMALLSIDDKSGSHCTPEDAEILALYAGILPGNGVYHDFIDLNIS